MIELWGGLGPPEAFPGDELAELASEILRHHSAEALQYGDLEGFAPLRRLLAEWLTADGAPATEDEILIVTGAKQGLDLVARALASPGDGCVASEPTYMNGLSILHQAGLVSVRVEHDAQGTVVDELETLLSRMSSEGRPLPRLIYEIPDFNNPTSSVLPEDRREKLVDLAHRFRVPILEDNPYRWLRYDGAPLRPLKHFDREGMVITAGSFAKILGPGLRVGWLHARADLVERFGRLKADGGTSALAQMLAYAFFQQPGSLERHLERIIGVLRGKRAAMLDALEVGLGQSAAWTVPAGGYYVWVTLNGELDGLDTQVMAKEAEHAGVRYYPGATFYTRPDAPRNQLRLAFSYASEDEIREGVAILGEVLARNHK